MAADPPYRREGGARILLVDDEVSALEVLALIQRGEGMHVTCAPDTRQALARIDEARPDLLVADFMMPGMNGAELVKAVRARPGHARIPVLMVSSAPEAALRPYRIAYDRFLRKPFGLDHFLAAVPGLLQPPGNERDAPAA